MLNGIAVAIVTGAGAGLVNGLVGSLSRGASYVGTLATAIVVLELGFVTSNYQPVIMPGAGDEGSAGAATALNLVALFATAAVVILTMIPVRARLDSLTRDDGGRISAVLVVAFVGTGALAALSGALDAVSSGFANPPLGFGTDLLWPIGAVLIGGSSLRGRAGAGSGRCWRPLGWPLYRQG